DAERAVAADHDERAEPELLDIFDAARGVIGDVLAAAGLWIREWIAAIGRAEDRAADAKDPGHLAQRQNARALGVDQAVKAVFDADAFNAREGGRFDHGPNHGVQPGGVAAARQNAKTLNRRCHPGFSVYQPARICQG